MGTLPSLRRLLSRALSPRAFSLIELLVVILVLGVLIAVAVPSYLGQKEKAQDSATKQYLTVAYKAAKAEAASNESAQGSYPAPASTLRTRLAAAEPGLAFSMGQYCSNAAGTSSTAVVVDSDDTNGSTLKLYAESDSGKIFQLTASSTGAPSVIRACSAPVVAGAAGAPAVSGTVQVGQTVSVSNGTNWESDAPLTYTYQWQNCGPGGADCQDVAGATAQSYVVQASDEDDQLRAVVTAANVTGSQSQETAKTSQALPAPPTSSGTGPTVSGTYQEGMVLTANPGSWGGTPPISYAYQWQRCGATLVSCQDISGQTAQSYTLAGDDIGSRVVAVVFATNAGGTTSARTDDGDPSTSPIVSSSVPVGLVVAYAGTATPTGWLEADGTAVSRSTYDELFAVAGTAYGTGNGSTTFNLPNLSGRIPLGAGSGVTRGASGGALDQSGTMNPWGAPVSLSFSWTETPPTPSAVSHGHTSNNPRTTGFWAGNWYDWVNPSVTLASNNQTFSVGAASFTASGSVTPSASYNVSNAPYRVVRYLIAASPTATAPCGALWGYGGSAAPAGAQLADGAPATGSLSSCLDSAFAGNAPDMKGRFALGKTASGTGSTLASGIGALDQTVSATLNTASTRGNVTTNTGTSGLTIGSHTHSVGYSTFAHMSNGGDVPLAAATSVGTGPNSNAGATSNAYYSPGTLSASGSGAQSPTSSAFNAPFLVTNWVAYTSSSYTPAIGTIAPFAGATAPSRWLEANGSCYSTSTYADLFAVFAYTYGGSGASFCVPDLKSKSPLGKAQSGTGSTLGASGGTLNPAPSLSFNGWTPSVNVPPHSFNWTVPGHTHVVGGWNYNYANATGGGGAITGRWPAGHTSTSAGATNPSGSIAAATRNGSAVSGTTASPPVGPAPYLGLNMMVYAGQ